MAASKDYYAILGVSRDADDADLKKAYRHLARTYHPDKNAGDKKAEERFKEVSEAYAVLSDPEKRAQYDRFGTVAGPGGFGDVGFGTIFEDLFEGFFGGERGRRTRARRGDDLRYDLEISLLEAADGLETKLQIPRSEACETCRGSGQEPGTHPETCATCRGQGQVRLSQGFLTVARPCPACRGQGSINRHPCKSCRGEGRQTRERLLKVTIPAGVEDGNQLRLSGEGEDGLLGGPAGDLYVVIHIRPHEIFVRQGPHLFCELPLSYPQVALGDTVEVPVLNGTAELTVPAGTQPGQRLSIKGKGMPQLRGRGRGDMVYEVAVEVPTRLNARQRELLEELRQASKDDAGPKTSTFVERMKKLFGT
ncbi:MAG: molecular chaperone DnaJ [Candidatus Rokuibacteriota bacterium]|nr:MAG: molecular chaperone DnaJ [Candidatus Rokubacteria bacterium]